MTGIVEMVYPPGMVLEHRFHIGVDTVPCTFVPFRFPMTSAQGGVGGAVGEELVIEYQSPIIGWSEGESISIGTECQPDIDVVGGFQAVEEQGVVTILPCIE